MKSIRRKVTASFDHRTSVKVADFVEFGDILPILHILALIYTDLWCMACAGELVNRILFDQPFLSFEKTSMAAQKSILRVQ